NLDLETVVAGIGIEIDLVAALGVGGHGVGVALIGDEGDLVADRGHRDLAGNRVVADVDTGRAVGHVELDFGAVGNAAFPKPALLIAGGDHVHAVAAGRNREDPAPGAAAGIGQADLGAGGVIII